ncbi:MAG: hypothetical protein AAF514_15920, partial [Verrucomicrobiota bacterium]
TKDKVMSLNVSNIDSDSKIDIKTVFRYSDVEGFRVIGRDNETFFLETPNKNVVATDDGRVEGEKLFPSIEHYISYLIMGLKTGRPDLWEEDLP